MIFFSVVGFLDATKMKKKGEGWSDPMRGLQWKKSLVVMIALLAYALLLKPAGFLICTTLFMAFLFRVIGHHRWPLVISGALAISIASYTIFEVLLKVQLPKGFLGS